MKTAYELALRALTPHLRSSRTPFEQAGGFIAEATTAIANANGSIDMIIPLDILCDPVNLKEMWNSSSFPVAILFRECMDDWYGLFPASIDFTTWYIVSMPGRDHDMYRARALAERAIRADFDCPNGTVKHAVVYKNRLITVDGASSVGEMPRREPAVEPAHVSTAVPSD